nr:hypothetical protein [uncultured Roseibium sp.]
MSHSLNTARALLEAKNFDGARKLVNKFLEETPDDIRCWTMRIQIEMKAGCYQEALRICRNVLQQHPDNAVLRELEFDALAFLRRKREAKVAFEKFRADFPSQYIRLRNMQFSLDTLDGNTQKLNRQLNKFERDDIGLSDKRNLGVFYHKTLNVFRAQKLMEDVHPEYPDDLELNKTLAQNSLLLGKLATARKYARTALRLAPGDRHMRTLIFISYVYYLPQFYILNASIMLLNLVVCYFGLAVAAIFGFFASTYAFKAASLFERMTSIVLDAEIFHSIYFFLTFLLSYFLVQYPKYFKFIYETTREVRLKRY